jgi:hypothetical protein
MKPSTRDEIRTFRLHAVPEQMLSITAGKKRFCCIFYRSLAVSNGFSCGGPTSE